MIHQGLAPISDFASDRMTSISVVTITVLAYTYYPCMHDRRPKCRPNCLS